MYPRKSQYDSTALQLQSNMNKLEVEVRTMRDEILSAESRYLPTARLKLFPLIFSYFLFLGEGMQGGNEPKSTAALVYCVTYQLCKPSTPSSYPSGQP
jgi:hypothetical protein